MLFCRSEQVSVTAASDHCFTWSVACQKQVLLFVATQVSVTAASDNCFKKDSAMSTSTHRSILS